MIQNSKINNQSSNINQQDHTQHNSSPQIKHNSPPQIQETMSEKMTRHLLEALPVGIAVTTGQILMFKTPTEAINSGILTTLGASLGIHLNEIIKYNNQKQEKSWNLS